MAPPEDQLPRPNIDFSGRIPKVYQPNPGTDLLSQKWWKEMSAKDALWVDIVHNIPSSVLSRRFKTGPVQVLQDLEQKAEKRAQKRCQKEMNRIRAQPSVEPEETPTTLTGRTNTPHELRITTPSTSLTTGTEIESEALAKETESAKQGGFKHQAQVKKSKCTICEELFSHDFMEADSNGKVVCFQCRDPPRDSNRQISDAEVDINPEPIGGQSTVTPLSPPARNPSQCSDPMVIIEIESKGISRNMETQGVEVEVLGSRKRKLGADGQAQIYQGAPLDKKIKAEEDDHHHFGQQVLKGKAIKSEEVVVKLEEGEDGQGHEHQPILEDSQIKAEEVPIKLEEDEDHRFQHEQTFGNTRFHLAEEQTITLGDDSD